MDGLALLRARNRSSESTATALTRRMDTRDVGELFEGEVER